MQRTERDIGSKEWLARWVGGLVECYESNRNKEEVQIQENHAELLKQRARRREINIFY